MPLLPAIGLWRASIVGIRASTPQTNHCPLAFRSKMGRARENLTVAGLAEGIKLSLDTSQGSTGWLVSARDLDKTFIGTRQDFVGVSAQAALELGLTFDGTVLAQSGVLGIGSDLGQAREWYERAIKLGSTEASRHLERLASLPK